MAWPEEGQTLRISSELRNSSSDGSKGPAGKWLQSTQQTNTLNMNNNMNNKFVSNNMNSSNFNNNNMNMNNNNFNNSSMMNMNNNLINSNNNMNNTNLNMNMHVHNNGAQMNNNGAQMNNNNSEKQKQVSDVKFVDDLHKQPCKSCQAPWVESSGFLADGKHSRCCRQCGVGYCSDCKYANMVKTKGSGTIDISSHYSSNNGSNNGQTPQPPGSAAYDPTAPPPPPYRRQTYDPSVQSNTSQNVINNVGNEMNNTSNLVGGQTYKSQWLCRTCAEDCGVNIGKPCSVCNAPWVYNF